MKIDKKLDIDGKDKENLDKLFISDKCSVCAISLKCIMGYVCNNPNCPIYPSATC